MEYFLRKEGAVYPHMFEFQGDSTNAMKHAEDNIGKGDLFNPFKRTPTTPGILKEILFFSENLRMTFFKKNIPPSMVDDWIYYEFGDEPGQLFVLWEDPKQARTPIPEADLLQAQIQPKKKRKERRAKKVRGLRRRSRQQEAA